MGAADGPAFATPKPGSKPIISPPCGCPECAAGPGIDHRKQWIEKSLGTLTQVVCYDFCPSCTETVIVNSVRNGPGWSNQCRSGHTWLSGGE